jgi:hypothetical protein
MESLLEEIKRRKVFQVGVGSIEGKTVTVKDVQIPRGTVFGSGFNPQDVSRDP